MGRKVIKLVEQVRAAKPFPIITLFHQADADLLNQSANSVTFALHREIIAHRLRCLKLSAVRGTTAVLTAVQVGIQDSMLVVHRNAQPTQWFNDSYSQAADYDGYINPKILSATDHNAIVEQENVSFPFIHANIRRFNKINIAYSDEFEGSKQETVTGFRAVLLQQGLDFLMGRHILDWRLHYGNIWVQEDIQNKLPKTTSTIQQYSSQLKSVFNKFPNLIQQPHELTYDESYRQRLFGHPWLDSRGNQELLSIEGDYMMRIHKHYNKQMALLMERLDQGVIDTDQTQQRQLFQGEPIQHKIEKIGNQRNQQKGQKQRREQKGQKGQKEHKQQKEKEKEKNEQKEHNGKKDKKNREKQSKKPQK